ncbi:hypothetical protein LTS18_009577 [Coniosporium uncinatum]|uniref:Uncharacterized protein n=1 Tax=Coniosporium uncinatum TaxID=93489 RepID=A0ACC3D0H5_9PEZI|nr:hypothetical protein LTS18_009577 [Coniosporium uncinatum]
MRFAADQCDLQKDGVTQASFCRDLKAQYHAENKGISASQLENFRNKKGPNAGYQAAVFYAAYVFFEKIRMEEGKGKSKHREAMEEKWPNGFDTATPH